MPKQKTRKTVAKRFKITKTGLVLRGHQYARHRKAHKSKRTISSYHGTVRLSHKMAAKIKKLLRG
ncbi:MAG: hypothetical protein UV73_C0002G0081 [Candidatus Gottesmanbacteria bacterium GW2011_GWA2_43_14]|uniref:Large ribosomal subunit protein bL35 n=1 Tax=Candidatus Gottesmanbacteria bacterium GW2011_GWA2_43_14 TaxID=1618443 RepID=A0A0G1DLA3_9BACT|nr:MAG: hypothetical protein UV73_C0002G0081 [Candidatus Gottesmanbacteria bacterium GW2011_GWA2_43_14]